MFYLFLYFSCFTNKGFSCLAGRTPTTSPDRYKGSCSTSFILLLSLSPLTSSPSLPFGLVLNEACSVSPGFGPNTDYINRHCSSDAGVVLAMLSGAGMQCGGTGGRWDRLVGRQRERERGRGGGTKSLNPPLPLFTSKGGGGRGGMKRAIVRFSTLLGPLPCRRGNKKN